MGIISTGLASEIEYDTGQTNDAMIWGIPTNGLILVDYSDFSTNWGHPSMSDPTLWIQSNDAAATDDYMHFRHNQTDPIIEWGNGDLTLTDGTGDVAISFSGGASNGINFNNGSGATLTVLNTGTAVVTTTTNTQTLSGHLNATSIAATGYITNKKLISSHNEGSGTPHAIDAGGDNNRVFTNEGTTVENHHDLPAAVGVTATPQTANGYTYIFIIQDSDGMQINAASGDTIRCGSDVTTSGGDISATAIGNSITLVSINSTEWMCTSIVGTWTFS